MPRVAILTPDPNDQDFKSRWRDVLARNAAPLEAAGIKVESRSWADADDLHSFDLVMPLLVWGYPRAHSRWVAKVTDWQKSGVRLENPASVLIWNADKAYLGRLGRIGAPVIPSCFTDRLSIEDMNAAADRFGSDRLVAKPRISSSAWRTIRWSPGDSLEGGPEGPAIIQPYLPAIEREGEVSLFYFGGAFSHAVSKIPRPGDFRVQPEFDGIIGARAASEDELEAAGRILAAVEEELLYARVDLVRDFNGRPALIELELIEPDLYLGYDPHAGPAYAGAVLERIRGHGTDYSRRSGQA